MPTPDRVASSPAWPGAPLALLVDLLARSMAAAEQAAVRVEPEQVHVLAAVVAEPGVPLRSLALRVGRPVTSVRRCVDRLAADGLLVVDISGHRTVRLAASTDGVDLVTGTLSARAAALAGDLAMLPEPGRAALIALAGQWLAALAGVRPDAESWCERCTPGGCPGPCPVERGLAQRRRRLRLVRGDPAVDAGPPSW